MSNFIDLLDASLAKKGGATLSILTRAMRLVPGWMDDGSPQIEALDWRRRVVPLLPEEIAQLVRRHPLS
jgi:hypothetical protein